MFSGGLSRVMRFFCKAFVSLALVGALAACGGAEDRKQEHIAKGEQFLADKNFDKARLEFKNALKIDPKDTDARFGLARTLEGQKQVRNAMSHYLAVVRDAPEHVEARLKVAEIYIAAGSANSADRQGLFEKARELLNESEKLAPQSVQLRVLKAMMDLGDGNRERARQYADEALKLEPDNAKANSLLVLMLAGEGQTEQGIEQLQTALKSNPDDPQLLRLLAVMFTKQKRYDEAVPVMKRTLAVAPENVANRRALVALLIQTKQFDEAEKALQQAIDLAPEDAAAQLRMVGFLRAHRSKQAGDERLENFIRAAPKADSLRFGKVRILLAEKDVDGAEVELKKIVEDFELAPPGLQARLALARIAAGRKDIDSATKYVEEVLAENAQDVDALDLRARIRLAKKQFADAILDLRAVARNRPNDVKVLTQLAQAHRGNNEPGLARDALERAVAADAKAVAPRMMLAQLMVDDGNLDGAAEQMSQAVEASPSDLNALQALTRLNIRRGALGDAEANAAKLKEEHPEQALGYFLAGEIDRAQQDFESASAQFDQALNLAPTSALSLAGKVQSQLAQGDAEDVLTTIDGFLQASPNNVAALSMKGRLLARMKRYDEAEQAFSKLLELQPKSANAVRGLGLTQLSAGKTEQAIETYSQGIKTASTVEPLVVDLALVLERLGRAADAVDVYEQHLEANPDSLVVSNNLAMLYLTQKENPKSLSRAKELAEKLKASDNPGFLDTLGWVYHQSGDVQAAIKVLEQAVEKVGREVPEFHYHLGVAYKASGDKVKARIHLEKAVSAERPYRGLEEAKLELQELSTN